MTLNGELFKPRIMVSLKNANGYLSQRTDEQPTPRFTEMDQVHTAPTREQEVLW